MVWMDTAIDDYEKAISEHNRNNGSDRSWEKSKMVDKIQSKAWGVRLEITKMIERQEADPKQKKINP
jgi:hypothetical protein